MSDIVHTIPNTASSEVAKSLRAKQVKTVSKASKVIRDLAKTIASETEGTSYDDFWEGTLKKALTELEALDADGTLDTEKITDNLHAVRHATMWMIPKFRHGAEHLRGSALLQDHLVRRSQPSHRKNIAEARGWAWCGNVDTNTQTSDRLIPYDAPDSPEKVRTREGTGVYSVASSRRLELGEVLPESTLDRAFELDASVVAGTIKLADLEQSEDPEKRVKILRQYARDLLRKATRSSRQSLVATHENDGKKYRHPLAHANLHDLHLAADLLLKTGMGEATMATAVQAQTEQNFLLFEEWLYSRARDERSKAQLRAAMEGPFRYQCKVDETQTDWGVLRYLPRVDTPEAWKKASLVRKSRSVGETTEFTCGGEQ